MLGDGTPRHAGNADYAFDADDDEEDGEDDEDEVFDPEGADAELLDALQEMVGATSNQMEEAVRKWCLQNGQAPHPRLREALNTLVVSMLPVAAYTGLVEHDPAAAVNATVPDPRSLMEMSLNHLPGDERRSLEEAMDQVSAYIHQFKNPRDMIAAARGLAGGGVDPQLPLA
jgi:hypothetical protein